MFDFIRPRYKKEDESVEDFIAYFDRLIVANDWLDEQSEKYLQILLESNSRFHATIDALLVAQRKSYKEIKASITAEYIEPYRRWRIEIMVKML